MGHPLFHKKGGLNQKKWEISPGTTKENMKWVCFSIYITQIKSLVNRNHEIWMGHTLFQKKWGLNETTKSRLESLSQTWNDSVFLSINTNTSFCLYFWLMRKGSWHPLTLCIRYLELQQRFVVCFSLTVSFGRKLQLIL